MQSGNRRRLQKKERLFYREEYSFSSGRGRCLAFPKNSTREGVFYREEYSPKTGKHASVGCLVSLPFCPTKKQLKPNGF
jgi:hypothetical protein